MFNLILKEFLVQKKILLIGFVYVFFAAFAFNNISPGGGAVYFMSPIAIIYILILYSSGYDDKNKADIIFNSLPLSREDIVIAKYTSFFFFTAYGLLCSIIVGLLSMATGFFNITRAISITDILMVLSAGMIFVSSFYPLYFKFGLNKMRIFNTFFFMFLMFAPSFLTNYIRSNPDNKLINNIISFMANTPELTLRVLFLICSAILFRVSMLFSIRIYKNKEF